MIFDKIAIEAERTNGWRVIGIAYTDAAATEGIISFEHAAPKGHFGTAHFDAHGGVPGFFWGHYDLSERAAQEDFAERVKSRC